MLCFQPDESFNVTHLMNHMKNQISALSDPFPVLDDLLKNWFGKKKRKETGLVQEAHG